MDTAPGAMTVKDVAELQAVMPPGEVFSMDVPMLGDPDIKTRWFRVRGHTANGLDLELLKDKPCKEDAHGSPV